MHTHKKENTMCTPADKSEANWTIPVWMFKIEYGNYSESTCDEDWKIVTKVYRTAASSMHSEALQSHLEYPHT